MKRLITTLSALAVAFGSFASTALADIKAASVDMTKLNIMFHKRVSAETELKQEEDKIKEEVRQRQEKLKSLDEEAKKIASQNDPTLSEAAAKKLRERFASVSNQFKAAQEEYNTFIQRRQVAFQEMVRRSLSIIAKELHDAVAAVAADGKYDVVIDSSAVSAQPGGRVYPYVNPALDITPLVLERLNADAPAGFDAQAELDRVTAPAAQPAAEPAK